MKPIAHILGNGPSRKDFVNTPEGDIFGCNLSDFSLPLTATFIMDKNVIDTIHCQRLALPFPIITPFALERIARQCPVPPKIYATLDDGIYNGWNAGHEAMKYCIKRYEKVHLWGVDSMTVDSIESDSHQKIDAYANPNNYKVWRTNWDKLFKSFGARYLDVTIHHPII